MCEGEFKGKETNTGAQQSRITVCDKSTWRIVECMMNDMALQLLREAPSINSLTLMLGNQVRKGKLLAIHEFCSEPNWYKFYDSSP